MSNKKIRIHAFLAQAGVASRRKSEQMVIEGKVMVNGKPATVGQTLDPEDDHVTVEGQIITNKTSSVVYLVNKPLGYVSTTSDELGRKTVLNMLPTDITKKHRLYPVGRLDIDSQGLILVTNNGQLAQRLTHPSFEHQKVYQVILDRRASKDAIEHLKKGVRLKEGFAVPDAVSVIDSGDNELGTVLEITLHEGKNRQVRRMMHRIGYEVEQLTRTQLGPFHLDDLDGQNYLEVTDQVKQHFPQL